MSKYIRFYKKRQVLGGKVPYVYYEDRFEFHDSLESIREAVIKRGGVIVKALDMEIKEDG